ncbi:MAG: hypothetical protein B6D56_06490 [Candidatus Omnitrophica bacterium 4484_70.1]|nr:MAG: hypothetical protein B6D56_06490 [Candidatus Omnitrophica bacterium 4484_70.1]
MSDKSIKALLQNKQKMVSPKIDFLKRLRLSIVSRHSANAELQIENCKLKILKWEKKRGNVQKNY